MLTAAIRVNAANRLGRINPHIYGQMFENAGNCVYDGLWVGPDAKMPNWNGIRRDVLEKLRAVRPSIIRWPGGTPSETYHWAEGVGPTEKRPNSLLAGTVWNTPGESNAFGTDEYIALCREVGADPYICVNVGTGLAEEAANWVEYCNHPGSTQFAAMRAANGNPEPFGVKYWGIGNESYFWHDARSYAKVIRHYVKLMKLVDPTIKIVAAGRGDDMEWNQTILEEDGEFIDYISIHPYYGSYARSVREYQDLVACPLSVEREVRELDRLIQQTTGSDRIRIAIDEWQVWHEGAGPENGGMQKCTLQDGIFAAGMMQMMHRTCTKVTMANLCNLVNCLPALVTQGDRLYLNPIYHAIHLYANHCGEVLLDSQVEVERYRSMFVDQVPYLDCTATCDENQQQLTLAVINRHGKQDIDCKISLQGGSPRGEGQLHELNGPRENAGNDFEDPEVVLPTARSFIIDGAEFRHCYPAHSVTLIELPIRPS